MDPSRIVIRNLRGTAVSNLPSVSAYRHDDGTEKLLLAPPLEKLGVVEDFLRRRPDIATSLLITTPDRLRRAFIARLSIPLADKATNALADLFPASSARTGMTARQAMLAVSCIFGACLWMRADIWQFLAFAHVPASIFFLSCVLLRLSAVQAAAPKEAVIGARDYVPGMPVYSVLIALRNEAAMARQIVATMSALNWPSGKIEIKIACEDDDIDTIEAFETLNLPSRFEILRVPVRGPRTKPKALNFALDCCLGEFIVIYDAEDRPHPDQLLEAWRIFRNAPGHLACLQAPLKITNGNASWLARMFTFEYAALFSGLLPYLASRQRLLTLGGTSNHFRRGALISVGGWDPHNVTEDADLGVRLRRLGYSARTITLPTLEEAPESFVVWRNQRTRWFKGWIQTWLVHMRSPRKLFRDLGWKDFVLFQILFAGHIGSAILHPLMFMMVFWMLANSLQGGSASSYAQTLAALDVANVVLGYSAFIALANRSENRGKGWSRAALAIGLPVYWTLHSIAAWRACWKYLTDRHHWEKTPHKPTASNESG